MTADRFDSPSATRSPPTGLRLALVRAAIPLTSAATLILGGK